MTSVKKSNILECKINNGDTTISSGKNYRSILINIYESMPSQKILQTTSFNFKLTNENGKLGYNWVPKLNMSVQSQDANHTFKEIIRMVKVNKYTLFFKIKLENKQIVHIKI